MRTTTETTTKKTRKKRKKAINFFFNLLLSLTSILLFLIIFEIFSSIFIPMGNPLWAYDENIGIRMMKNKCSRYISQEYNVEICGNSLGFRDVEHNAIKPEDTFRILLLGDSFVAAREVELNKTFGRILERELNKVSSKKVEVINMGVGGQGTGGQLLTLRHYGSKLNPDLIILSMFLENDICNNYPPLEDRRYIPLFDIGKDGELVYLGFKPAPLISNPAGDFISRRLFGNTFSIAGKSFRAISRKLKRKSEIPVSYYTYLDYTYPENIHDASDDNLPNLSGEFKKAWEIEDKLIGELKKESDRINAKLFIITLFSKEQATDFKSIKESLKERGYSFAKGLDNELDKEQGNEPDIEFDAELPIKRITPILEKHRIDYLHTYPVVRDAYYNPEGIEELFFRQDPHFNENGHELIARIIYKALLKKGMVEIKK